MPPDAKDIDDLFARKIAPRLRTFERERQSALEEKGRRWRIGGIIGAGLVGAILAFCYANDYSLFIAIPFAVAALFGIWVWASMATGDYEDKLRDTLMAAVCNHLGNLSYSHDNFEFMGLKLFSDVHLIPGYSSSAPEDLIEGTYRNCRFMLAEVKLEKRSHSRNGSNSETVFDGLLLRISVPQKIDGTILVARDYGSWLNTARGWFRSGERVEIPHAAFEDKYEVYASNASVALDVISHDFVENFLKLSRVLGSDNLRAAFTGGEFLLSADGVGGFLDEFSADTPTSELKVVFRKVVEETQLIHRVIDQLHEPRGDSRYRSKSKFS